MSVFSAIVVSIATSIGASITVVELSEFAKNCSEIIKHFFECIEIADRIKRERKKMRINDKENCLEVTCCCQYKKVIRPRGKERIFAKEPKPVLLISPGTESVLRLNHLLSLTESFKVQQLKDDYGDIDNVLESYSSDSMVAMQLMCDSRRTKLVFHTLNLVPSSDDHCYSIQFSFNNSIDKVEVVEIIRRISTEVLTQAASVYQRYRHPLALSYDRLTLELRVLHRLGFDPEFSETDDGFYCDLILSTLSNEAKELVGRNSAMINIALPQNYPKEAPIIRMVGANNVAHIIEAKQIWNDNLTLGHIVRALQEEE